MRYTSEFEIRNTKVGPNNPTYFIADIASNHDGDINRAIDLIYLAKQAGANAAKFQHFTADSLVSDFGFRALGPQQSHQETWEKSVYDTYRDATLNSDWTATLREVCDAADIAFLTSPYSLELADEVDSYVPAYKIGSGDITWIEIIQHIANKGKPVLIATGASTMDDVSRAVNVVTAKNPNVCVMQCNTNYTGTLENFRHIQLNVLHAFRSMFPGVILGLSDHTPSHTTVLGAVAMGACVIEKHFTDDTSRSGPDHAFSISPIKWREMVERTRELELALGTGLKQIEDNEAQTVVLQRRAIRTARDLNAGETITKQDLIVLRPCPVDALPPYRIEELIGRSVRRNLKEGEHLTLADIL